jgi:hypothetical protein
MDGRAASRRSIRTFHLPDETSGCETQRGSGAVEGPFGTGAAQSRTDYTDHAALKNTGVPWAFGFSSR